MVDEIITKQELIDAKRDAHDLGDSVNEKKIIQPRYGAPYRSIPLVTEDIENTINEWDSAVKTITQEGGIPDLAVSTWSGRTQADKNKENISAQDYGAKGDATTNDSTAFIGLEAAYQGRVVDLLGKTYLVSTLPYGNEYINGFFKIGGTTIAARGQSRLFGKTTTTPLNLNRDGQLNYSPRHTLTRATGAGSGSVVQSFCIDHVNRYMYTLTATSPPFVSRYNLDSSINTTAIDKTNYSEILGHQGLDVEYLDSNGNTLLWTSHPAGVGAGGKAIAFKYKVNPALLDEYETWTLLETTVSESITPSISADGRYLLCRFQTGGGDLRIRVFDMADVRAARSRAQYNISQLYLAEFTIPRVSLGGGESVQDIACDGNYIYVLWATFSMDKGDNIIVLDMSGNIVQYFDSHTIGLAESIETTSTDNQHEPETLCFSKTANGTLTLLYGVSYGSNPLRKFTMYELGGDTPTHVTTKEKPSFMAESVSGMEYCVPAGRPMRLGTYSKESGYTPFISFDHLGRMLRRSSSSLRVGGNTNGIQWFEDSTQSNAIFGRWGAEAFQYPIVGLLKSSADVVGNSVANGSGVTLGQFAFYSDVGNGTSTDIAELSAGISAITTGLVVSGKSPSKLNFSTTSASGNYGARWSIESNGSLVPALSNNYSIGDASNLVSVVYAGTGTINTSDERLKQQFRSQTEREKDAALEIKNSICLFKFNDAVDLKGDGARWHVGVKAQQVISILESHDLDPFEYAFVCFDEWGETEDQPSGSRYAVRYDELAMFILAAM